MISRKAEYALRVISYLAYEPETPSTAAEMAFAIEAPRPQLDEVLAGLSEAGILAPQHDRCGSFLLQRQPRDISVLDVVQAVGAFQRVETCPLGAPAETSGLCPLHRRVGHVLTAAEQTLDGFTFGELLEEPRLVCSLSCIAEPPAAQQHLRSH